jgi:hypothetical protein
MYAVEEVAFNRRELSIGMNVRPEVRVVSRKPDTRE